ncbi:MAG: sulfatase-like hydrolase/transferase [Sedimentisphaerales bacterium]|nr:sulfatase-like hydrolase/transferase [Sedimentisphaerales bacterium]
MLRRRDFLKSAGLAAAGLALGSGCASFGGRSPGAARPNIILCMTDDQGFGDTGYNGHKYLKTPVLDEMAATCLRFDRFYAAAPVCSPTRGSVMTGRHPNRFGCFAPNYSIRPEEITIAEVLKSAGYATGHFGKWHLGPVKADCPVNPGGSGFDEWLSHDNFFEIDPPLTRNGEPAKVIKGESSEIVVEEALRFVKKAAENGSPFLAVVWFGSPHTPHKATAEDREPYKHLSEKEQHYLGEIAAVDRAVGMLRTGLADLKIAENTMLWFCSDNGATGPGSTGGLRGKKASLWEGGIRVPAILEWPDRIRKPFAANIPCCTSDIYPTIIDILGLDVDNQVEPVDGISLRGLIEGAMVSRPRPIAFWKYAAGRENRNESYIDRELLKGTWRQFSNFRHPHPRVDNFPGHAALIDNNFKLHQTGEGLELYDISADPAETKNIAVQNPEVVARMKATLNAWQASVEESLAGRDYIAD